jgi:NAD(P)-dependent dehydrogenase (short-subunit alcohol dehydrogenase family)
MLLENKVAIVTGAGSGIGRAIAISYAGAGARVILADIDMEGAEETAGQIAAKGGTSRVVRCDVSRPDDHEALVAATVKQFGALHIAANNAGIAGPSAPPGNIPSRAGTVSSASISRASSTECATRSRP